MMDVSRDCSDTPLYLAFDLSTQTLKVLAIDDQPNVVMENSVSFDKDFPEFGTSGGVKKDGVEVKSPVLMWVQAVDMLMGKLAAFKFPFHQVKGVSGTAQQHGSVYWKKDAEKKLRKLDANKELTLQLRECFAIYDCPVWMDSSTTKQCLELEKHSGGPDALAKITGSRAYERFTGNQIAKIHLFEPEKYECCERISLVSSFLASLFLGHYAPIDYSDGSGMNLLDIHSKQWDQRLADACSPDLIPRLGSLVSSKSVIGCISEYMAERYGFNTDCVVTAFTGDNPASFVGMCLNEGDVAVSLGTSDTLMFSVRDPKPSLAGHVFVNPLDQNSYMAMLCYKNGSLTRESIRNKAGIKNWTDLEKSLQCTSPGNCGNIGIYLIEQEIFPFAQGVMRFNGKNEKVDTFERDVEIRALIEGQFLAKRVHSERLGYFPGKDSRVLVTGGASKNAGILQVIADVFNIPVYRIEDTTNSACLGSAYLARSLSNRKDLALTSAKSPTLVATPRQEAVEIYNNLCPRYIDIERLLVGK